MRKALKETELFLFEKIIKVTNGRNIMFKYVMNVRTYELIIFFRKR